MKDDYPQVSDENPKFLASLLRKIVGIRKDDLSDWDNLKNIYLPGRRTFRAPSSSADVLPGDTENDVFTDPAGAYEYRLVKVSGNLMWRRVALGSF